MPNRCHACGIEPLESQRFIEENFPFMRRRSYCSACHQRLVHRIYLGFTLLILAAAVVTIFEAMRSKGLILNYFGFAMLFLVIVQWLMILPHELGHAIAAQLFGYTQIRILIGVGKPLLSFDLAGFYWVFNPIPFGGLTLSKPPAKLNRWKHLIFVSAGLAVNAAVAFGAWLFIGPDGVFHSSWSVAKLLFWGNLIVIAENLFPRPVQTSYGNAFTDGWQIWHTLFSWNKPIKPRSNRIPAWEVLLCYILKWGAVLILFIGTIFFIAVVFIPFMPSYRSTAAHPLKGMILWSAFFSALGSVCGWYCWRVFREPIARVRKSPSALLAATMRSLFSSEQLKILQRVQGLLLEKNFTEAATLSDQMMSSIPDHNSEAYVYLLILKLQCISSTNDIQRAEAVCLAFLQEEIRKEQKLKVIDGFACQILYQPSPFLKQAERFARLGLEMAPGTLTLKGTLGSILAEQGSYSEAESLLVECLDRSPALHDRAIASFYLGMIKIRNGDAREGKRLIKRAMKMYPEDWMVAKGTALLKD